MGSARSGEAPTRFEAVAVIGGLGDRPGELIGPFGLRIGPDGVLYVVDDLAHRIVVFDQDGAFTRTLGRQGSGPGEVAWLDALNFASTSEIYVADTGNNRIQVWSPDGRPRMTSAEPPDEC